MSSTCTLWCLVDGDKTVFSVDISIDRSIDNLKDSIKQKRSHRLDKFDATDLILWKLEILEPVKPATDLVTRIQSHGSDYSQFATELKEPSDKVLAVFANKPDDCLHVFISLLTELSGGKRPRSSSGAEEEAKRMKPDDPHLWLRELHSKIWGGTETTLTRTVAVTEADYAALKARLNGLHDYTAVKPIKFDILRSLREKIASSNLQDEVEDDDFEARDNHKLFPSVFTYLDLAPLELKANVSSRFSLPLLVRQDYKDMTELIDGESRASTGSVIVSGQPGTGKTTYLYFRLFECMIEGRPFLFQSTLGDVYHVTKAGVEIVTSLSTTEPITAFIDGDKGECNPREFLLCLQVQLIVATSPKGANLKWTKQLGDNSAIKTFAFKLWSREELLLTGLFLRPSNYSLDKLEESTKYFGFNPCACFQAALSANDMNHNKNQVIEAINSVAGKGIDKLLTLIRGARMGTSDLPSRIFQIYPDPDDERRSLSMCRVTISLWTLRELLDRFDVYQGQSAYALYISLAQTPAAAPFRGLLFKTQVLSYLERLKTGKVFPIRSLANSDQTVWTYRGPIRRFDFDKLSFPGQIQEAIQQRNARHLVPKAKNYAAVDSIIYDPNDTVLTCIQVTMNGYHPIAVSGLRYIQRWLEADTGSIKLIPTKQQPWRFLFVVLSTLESNFELQTFKGDTKNSEWAGKVDQYVLGLEENRIFGLQ